MLSDGVTTFERMQDVAASCKSFRYIERRRKISSERDTCWKKNNNVPIKLSVASAGKTTETMVVIVEEKS